MNKKDILELLATKEVIIVLVILAIVVLIYAFLWFMEFLKKQDEKKKLQNNTMELKKLVSEIKEIEEKEKATKESDVVVKEEEKTPVLEEKIEVEVPKEEVKEEKIEKIEENPKNIDSIMLNNQEEKVEISMDNKTIPVDAPKNEEEVIKYKDEVYAALYKKFGYEVKRKNKSIKVNGNTYRKSIDVVPAFSLTRNIEDGIQFITDDGVKITNYPLKQISNENQKNKLTNYKYKKYVRIFK